MLEIRAVERDELPQVGLVEQALDLVDLVRLHAEPRHEPVAHRPRGGARELEADDVAHPALPELDLDGLEQVVGVVRDLEVGVARHAEERALGDLHPGEEHRQEVRDHGLERHELLAGRDEAVEALRHLDAREALLVGLGVERDDAEREREPGDVRERLARARRRAA